MFLGIEIGGTKLQLGVGRGDGVLVALERRTVDIARGAAGIREQIVAAGKELAAAHPLRGVGYGFGGPLDVANGRTIKSHQVAGWDDFPLADWTRDQFGVPVVLNNDCDAAALAEARFGAGAGTPVVFYVTVGTGVGGGLVIDGKLFRGGRGIAAEIGHLRPGLDCEWPDSTVEAAVAGPGIVKGLLRYVEHFGVHLRDPKGSLPRVSYRADFEREKSERLRPTMPDFLGDPAQSGEVLREIAILDSIAGGDLTTLTAKDVFVAASQGSNMAKGAIDMAVRTLGWAVAQVITLVAPNRVVVGGGVSLAGEEAFFQPLREEIARYVFPPLRDTYEVVPAALGEEVVVHGAIAAARDALA
jgi:glucokinase